MVHTTSSISAATSRVQRRKCSGWTLLEVLFSTAIFSLVLVITFLPFKMTNASLQTGTARVDRLENVRIEFGAMVKDIRAGQSVTFSSPIVLSSGASGYRAIAFTDVNGARVSYTWQPLNTGPTTEWTVVRDQQVGGASQTGYPKIVVPKGVRDFWFQSIPAPGQPLPANNDATTVLAYMLVYPDDAARPLPDASKAPIELGTSVTLRN